MEKSSLLIAELMLAGIIEPTEENIAKAKAIIRVHLNNTFRDAVLETFMATNKKVYKEPVFED